MIRRFSYSLMGRILAALLQVAILAALARHLGVEEFGVFVATSSVTLVLIALADFGMGPRLLRGVRSRVEDASLTTLALSRIVTVALIMAVTAALTPSEGSFPVHVVAFTLYVAGEATGDLSTAILQGARKSLAAVSLLCVRRVIVLGVLVTFPAPIAVVAGCLIGAAVGFAVFGVFAIARRARPRGIVGLIRENAGLILSGGASSVSQLDAALVATGAATAVAGLYGSATRLFNPLNLAISTLLQVFVPEIVAATGSARVRVFRKVRGVVLVSGGLICASAWAGPWVVRTLYGEEFSDAAPIAVAVFICAGISAVGQVHMAWYYAVGVPRSVSIGLWLSVICGLALILALSSGFGLYGAASGLVIMHILTALAIILPWRSSIKEYL